MYLCIVPMVGIERLNYVRWLR